MRRTRSPRRVARKGARLNASLDKLNAGMWWAECMFVELHDLLPNDDWYAVKIRGKYERRHQRYVRRFHAVSRRLRCLGLPVERKLRAHISLNQWRVW